MKTLCRISTVVLSCLVLAAPAAANASSEGTLEASATKTTLGGSAATYTLRGYTLHGVDGAKNTHGVYLMPFGFGEPCKPENVELLEQIHPVTDEGSFEETVELPLADYPVVGEYTLCAFIGYTPEKSSWYRLIPIHFTVTSAPPTPVAAPVAPVAVTPASTPPATAPVAPVVTPVMKPMSKLAKALKQCKKLKKHSKQVACEKRAKKRYGPKPKRH
jgi:hypothetical protein